MMDGCDWDSISVFAGEIRDLEGLPVTKPYVEEKLGHKNIIRPDELLGL